MKKFFTKASAFFVALALVVGFGFTQVQASSDKFIVKDMFYPGHGITAVHVGHTNAGYNDTNNYSASYSSSTYGSEKDVRDAAVAGVVAWANSDGGFSGITSDDVYFPGPAISTVGVTGNASDLTLDSTHRLVTDSEKTTWNAKGSGTVTSVTAGTGLSGGTITSTGTISMPNTGTAGTYSGVTTDAQGRVTAGTNRSWNNTPGRSIVTGTGATGFQPSSTKDTIIKYGVKVTSTASIASGQEGYVTLEIAPTNSATAGDWVNMGLSCGNGQTYSLAIALQGVQPTYCELSATVPAGWYAKLRSVNVTGTPSYSYLGGQEMSF